MRKFRWMAVASGIVAAGLSLASVIAVAQAPGGQPGGQRGQRGERGQFDPERMREMMAERYKEMLGATDDEMKVIQPLITNVMEKQQAARTGGGMGMFGMMGRGGRRGGDTPGAPGAQADRGGDRRFGPQTSPEVEALQKTLEAPNASAAELKAKMEAVRAARKKAEAELQKAREELRGVVTAKQEAQLLLAGILD